MVSALRKWWRGDSESLAELKARVAAGPETVVVPANWEFTLREATVPAAANPPQRITVDTDIRLMKRALVMGTGHLKSGRVRTIETGPTCEKCGQAGVAYLTGGKTEILVCSQVERGIAELFYERRKSIGCYDDRPIIEPPPLMPNTLVIVGVPIKSIECGRHLKMSLRMRFCWFD